MSVGNFFDFYFDNCDSNTEFEGLILKTKFHYNVEFSDSVYAVI